MWRLAGCVECMGPLPRGKPGAERGTESSACHRVCLCCDVMCGGTWWPGAGWFLSLQRKSKAKRTKSAAGNGPKETEDRRFCKKVVLFVLGFPYLRFHLCSLESHKQNVCVIRAYCPKINIVLLAVIAFVKHSTKH